MGGRLGSICDKGGHEVACAKCIVVTEWADGSRSGLWDHSAILMAQSAWQAWVQGQWYFLSWSVRSCLHRQQEQQQREEECGMLELDLEFELVGFAWGCLHTCGGSK